VTTAFPSPEKNAGTRPAFSFADQFELVIRDGGPE
jgi:hypothetical protein